MESCSLTPRDRQWLERIIACVDAIAKRIEEMGEVARRLSPAILATMPGVDWKGVKAIREVIAHEYDEIDLEVLAHVVRSELPGLRDAVVGALTDPV